MLDIRLASAKPKPPARAVDVGTVNVDLILITTVQPRSRSPLPTIVLFCSAAISTSSTLACAATMRHCPSSHPTPSPGRAMTLLMGPILLDLHVGRVTDKPMRSLTSLSYCCSKPVARAARFVTRSQSAPYCGTMEAASQRLTGYFSALSVGVSIAIPRPAQITPAQNQRLKRLATRLTGALSLERTCSGSISRLMLLCYCKRN